MGCAKVLDKPISNQVGMIGIDYQDKEFLITLQLIGRSTTVYNGAEKARYYQGTGPTVGGALKAAELKSGSNLAWEELKVVAVGRQAAIHSGQGSLQALNEKLKLDPKILVTVVEPMAWLLVKGDDRIKGVDTGKVELRLMEGIRKLMLPESRLSGFLKTNKKQSEGSLVSYVAVGKTERSDMTVAPLGSGVFYQNTLFAMLDCDLTTAVLSIQDQPQQLDMKAVGSKLDMLSGVIKKSKVKLIPIMHDGKLSFIVSLSLDGESVTVSDRSTIAVDDQNA